VKTKHPKYTHSYIDQHGRPRFYLRRPGHVKIPLPGLPWSPEFMEARQTALEGSSGKVDIGAKRTIAGSVNAGLASYYSSGAFKALAPSTQSMRRNILERFREAHGDKRIGLMPRKAIQAILDSKTPAAARNWKKTLRGFITHCLSLDLMTVDPLAGVVMTKMKTKGHHPWVSDECAKFERHHPLGTRARLAYELLLQAGQSRCDVVRMGRQHVRNGLMTMRRQKTGVSFNIEMQPSLNEAIEAMPASNHLTFLITALQSSFREQELAHRPTQ